MTPSRTPSPRRPPRASGDSPSQEPPADDSPSQSPNPSASPSDAAPSESYGQGSPETEFLVDPGPAFDPKSAPAAPDPDELDDPGILDEWDEGRVRELLTLQGEITHAALRVGRDDHETWIHTERDLGAIAPPLTRILNRYDITRAAAAAGDEALLAAAVTRYGVRNFTKRRRMQAALAAQGPQPVTGVPAEPETGPEDDEAWQRVHAEPPAAITPKGVGRR